MVLKHKITDYYPYFLTLIISVISAFVCFHPSINYNSDLKISSVGIVISNTIAENPFNFHYLLPGFKANGGFTQYVNWPPLSYWLLALWLKFISNSFLSARIFMLIIKILTDLILVKYLTTLKISNKQITLLSIIFCLIPFRLIYLDLIFGDSFAYLFIIAYLIFEEKQKFILAFIISILGILSTWYFGVFIVGFYIYKLYKKESTKLILTSFFICIFTIIIWITYIYIINKLYIKPIYSLVQKNKQVIEFAFFKQIVAYSWFNILIGKIALFSISKWIIKLIAELVVLTMALLTLNIETRKKLAQKLHLISLGFLVLFFLLPYFFIIHNHNIYFLSFGIALYCSSKINVQWHYLSIISLPIMYICIYFTEFQFLETKLRDNYILNKINSNQCKTVFINNPSHKSINQQFICTPWLIMYASKVMVYERMGNTENISMVLAQKVKDNQNCLIISSVPIAKYTTKSDYYKGIYFYQINN